MRSSQRREAFIAPLTFWAFNVHCASYRIGHGRIFLKTSASLSFKKAFRINLISAGFILLDSTFKMSFALDSKTFHRAFLSSAGNSSIRQCTSRLFHYLPCSVNAHILHVYTALCKENCSGLVGFITCPYLPCKAACELHGPQCIMAIFSRNTYCREQGLGFSAVLDRLPSYLALCVHQLLEAGCDVDCGHTLIDLKQAGEKTF